VVIRGYRVWRFMENNRWEIMEYVSTANNEQLFKGYRPVILTQNNSIYIIDDTRWGSGSPESILTSKDGYRWTWFKPDFSSLLPIGTEASRGVVLDNKMWIFGDHAIWYEL
jgi:hypothetical protein